MKKINKKGFFLSETMVVIAVVAVVILSVFKLFNSVYYRFIETEDYNTANAINALSNIKKYYESLGAIDTDLITEDIFYVDLTTNEKYESEYYTRLKNEFKIDSVYLIDLNKLNDTSDFYINLRKYLDTLRNKEGIILLVSINGKEFAYTEIMNYSMVTLVGKEEDEFGVYIPIDGIFVDPGYKNWDGEEPITTWENGKELDTSKAGTYYLHYDFNGILLRRKVVVGYSNAAIYIEKQFLKEETLHNGLVQTTVEYNGTSYNAGIRYVGPLTGDNAVKNQVYFNCEETDSSSVAYGSENYDYANSCEVWRIIGVFEVEDEEGNIEKRVKIINTNSTFQASWDSSTSRVNSGYGINQWGPSGNYAGADLMQLLNGYYIGKTGSECKYNTDIGQSGFSQTCDTEGDKLKDKKMKPLTINALGMIDEAVWYTYATNTTTAETAYLQEKGIVTQYTGISECSSCSDGVKRTTRWTGLVGLMSVSDIGYANGWLYNGIYYPSSISPSSYSSYSYRIWGSSSSSVGYRSASNSYGVWPALYLSTNVDIVGGDGNETPYKLKLIEEDN